MSNLDKFLPSTESKFKKPQICDYCDDFTLALTEQVKLIEKLLSQEPGIEHYKNMLKSTKEKLKNYYKYRIRENY
jgi:hypothetical protein